MIATVDGVFAARRWMPFQLRGLSGTVEVSYGANEQPKRWGFDLLGLGFGLDLTRGSPVIQARTRYSAEGYAAFLGWVQVVDFVVPDEPEPVWVAPDVAPQALDANTPYVSFGVEPTLFDAPASTAVEMAWRARAFLTYTPDCVMSRVVEPLCGVVWGYDIENGQVQPRELVAASTDDWVAARRVLRLRLPTWTFGGQAWTAPNFDRGSA